MLTSEDHRQLAERCIRLARECTKPSVAEYLMTLAASYLDLAERALRLRESRRQHIKVMQKEQIALGRQSVQHFPHEWDADEMLTACHRL